MVREVWVAVWASSSWLRIVKSGSRPPRRCWRRAVASSWSRCMTSGAEASMRIVLTLVRRLMRRMWVE